MHETKSETPPLAGTTTAYQLYRLSEWLWKKEIRKHFQKIVSYVSDNRIEPTRSGEASRHMEFIRSILGDNIPENNLVPFHKRLMDLQRIKDSHPVILDQLKNTGNRIFTYESLECTLLTHFYRLWHYGENQLASSFILLAPKFARVLSFETSESSLGSLKQMDGLSLTNVQLYVLFNRIRGLKNRSTLRKDYSDIPSQIGFLCRTVRDIEIIHNSKLLRHLSFIPTPGEESTKFQIGQYFVLVGKILGLKYRSHLGPSDVKIGTITDFSGAITFQIRDKDVIESGNSPIGNDVKKWIGSVQDFPNDSMGLNYVGYVFAIGFWSLEEDFPWIMHIIPLGPQLDITSLSNYNAFAYLNTRKKVSSKIISQLFALANPLSHMLEKDGFTHYMEPYWVRELFIKYLASRNLPEEQIDKSDSLELNEITRYFEINFDYLSLYIQPNPSKEFSLLYKLPESDKCPHCLSELYDLDPFSIAQLIVKHDADISIDLPEMGSDELYSVVETISDVKKEITKVIETNDIEGAKAIFEDLGTNEKVLPYNQPNQDEQIMEVLKSVLDSLSSISHFKLSGKKIPIPDLRKNTIIKKEDRLQIVLSFPTKNVDLISGVIKLFHVSIIEIQSHGITAKLNCSKNCPLGHNISINHTIEAGLLRFIKQRVSSLLITQTTAILKTTFEDLKMIAVAWFDIVSNAKLQKSTITNEQKLQTSNKLKKIVEALAKLFLDPHGNIHINSAALNELTIGSIIFMMLCREIKDKKFTSYKDLEKIFNFIITLQRMTNDPNAAQFGVISNPDILLRAIALRYSKFHYDRALGSSQQTMSEADFHNYDIKPLMERCIELTQRKGNLYRNLKKINPRSSVFQLLCEKIIVGEVTSVNAANTFLKTVPVYLYQEGTQSVRPERRITPKKVQPRIDIKKDQRESGFVKKFSSDRAIVEFGELYYGWRRLQDAKAKTHQPLLYKEARSALQNDFNKLVSILKDIDPVFRKLEGSNVESKAMNKVFREIGTEKKFSKGEIMVILRKTLS